MLIAVLIVIGYNPYKLDRWQCSKLVTLVIEFWNDWWVTSRWALKFICLSCSWYIYSSFLCCANKFIFGYRGNAVMRSAAKKQLLQDIDVLTPLDVSVHVPIDTSTKMASRPNKSKANMVIRRIFRTIRVITVVAAVNLPIYMILLFKDWIDKWYQHKWPEYHLWWKGFLCSPNFLILSVRLWAINSKRFL